MQFTDGKDLNNIVLRAPIGICILDADTLVADIVNDKFLEVAGKPYEAIYGQFYWDAFAEARAYYEAALSCVVETGEAYYADEVELMLIRHGREEMVFVTFVYSPIINDTGKVSKVAVWVLENTKQVNEREKVNAARIAIQQERDRLRDFLMQIPAGICILQGAEMVYELVNPLYQELFPGRELLGKSLLAAIPEISNGPIWNILKEVYKTGKPFEGNELLVPLARTPDGPVVDRYFNFIYQARQDESGKTDGIIVCVIEVTHMIEAQQEQLALNEELSASNEEQAASNEELTVTNEELNQVRQSLEDSNRELAANAARLRMAIKTTNLGTWVYHPKTGELFWSKECRDVYGIPVDLPASFEIFAELIYPEDRNMVQKAIANAIDPAKRDTYDLSYRIIRFDNGEIRWIKVQGGVQFENEQATMFIGTVLDITEMKNAEEKSAKLTAIIASSDDAIVSKTLESVITSWNASAERIFGYTADEIIGETIYKLIPPDRQEEEPEILARLKTGERVDHFETKRLTKDGRLIDVSVTVSPVKDKAGNIIGLSKIARDITERKLDETRKNDFIGMVSHELKTPLTSLNAILQMANLKLKDSDDRFLSGAMQKANQQVKRMTGLINGFLNISRLESGKILIEKSTFDIEVLIADVIEETNLTMSSHDIHFVPCQSLPVTADRDKISSVISNLISNAIKYSPKGKKIEVKCEAVEQNIVISVEDEGMGIASDQLNKVFERYHRVETIYTRHISGFGIGLYLSSEIIEHHGGKIWAESESGKGSTFYFSLPL